MQPGNFMPKIATIFVDIKLYISRVYKMFCCDPEFGVVYVCRPHKSLVYCKREKGKKRQK